MHSAHSAHAPGGGKRRRWAQGARHCPCCRSRAAHCPPGHSSCPSCTLLHAFSFCFSGQGSDCLSAASDSPQHLLRTGSGQTDTNWMPLPIGSLPFLCPWDTAMWMETAVFYCSSSCSNSQRTVSSHQYFHVQSLPGVQSSSLLPLLLTRLF